MLGVRGNQACCANSFLVGRLPSPQTDAPDTQQADFRRSPSTSNGGVLGVKPS
jgi:hypothetical protein